MQPSKLVKPIVRFPLWVVSCLLLAGLNSVAISATKFSLYKSTDRGASWFAVGEGLPTDARINALSVVGETVLAGTDRGIFLSRDAGANWQPARRGIGTDSRVLCLTIQDRLIFAGTHKHGVLVSDDEGTTWKPANPGLTDMYVRSLLTVGSKLFAGTDRQGVFLSENAGASWVNQRAGLPDSAQVFDLAAVDGTILAGLYSKGLYRWEAERAHWSKSGDVVPLEIVTAGKILVAGHNPGGVFVSEDMGTTWSAGNSGLPVNAPTWTPVAENERVWLGTSGKVGLVAHDIGLFASKDHGKSWVRSDAGLPPSGAAIRFVVAQQFMLAGISAPSR